MNRKDEAMTVSQNGQHPREWEIKMRRIRLKTKAAIALSAMLAVMLTGCLKHGQQQEQTTNGNFNVELLFEKDGCKIYRFTDGGHAVYWTDCRGKVETVHQQSSGKSSYEVRVQNETVE